MKKPNKKIGDYWQLLDLIALTHGVYLKGV